MSFKPMSAKKTHPKRLENRSKASYDKLSNSYLSRNSGSKPKSVSERVANDIENNLEPYFSQFVGNK